MICGHLHLDRFVLHWLVSSKETTSKEVVQKKGNILENATCDVNQNEDATQVVQIHVCDRLEEILGPWLKASRKGRGGEKGDYDFIFIPFILHAINKEQAICTDFMHIYCMGEFMIYTL